MFRDLVIFDPVAAGAHRDRVRELIYHLLPEATFRGVVGGEKVRPDVERAVVSGYDRVIVAGDDALVAEVAGGMLYTGVPLGVLPLGRNREFADSLGMPMEPEAACELLAAGGSVREAAAMNLNGSLCLSPVVIGSRRVNDRAVTGRRPPRVGRSWRIRIVIDGVAQRTRVSCIVVGRSTATRRGGAKLLVTIYRRVYLSAAVAAIGRRLVSGQAFPAQVEQLEAAREVRVEARSAAPVFGARALPRSKVVAMENLPGALRVVTPSDRRAPPPGKPFQDSLA